MKSFYKALKIENPTPVLYLEKDHQFLKLKEGVLHKTSLSQSKKKSLIKF